MRLSRKLIEETLTKSAHEVNDLLCERDKIAISCSAFNDSPDGACVQNNEPLIRDRSSLKIYRDVATEAFDILWALREVKYKDHCSSAEARLHQGAVRSKGIMIAVASYNEEDIAMRDISEAISLLAMIKLELVTNQEAKEIAKVSKNLFFLANFTNEKVKDICQTCKRQLGSEWEDDGHSIGVHCTECSAAMFKEKCIAGGC